MRKPRKPRRRLILEQLESRTLLHGIGVISGSVFIDADADGVRDAGELGVPGIVVRLSGTSESEPVQRSTMTDDDGLYTFAELEEGTYQISKRASDALLGAGNDALGNLTLVDDQVSNGHAFGESGLRAAFVSIAWSFSTRTATQQVLRETIARVEERSGNTELAASIRSGDDGGLGDSNQAPVAGDDSYTTEEDQPLTVPAATGVLANDTDADNDPLAATLVGQPNNGTVQLNQDGSFTYTPDSGFTGTDSFTYQARDTETSSALATVTIDVTQGNVSPTAADDDYLVEEDQVLTVDAASGVLSNDSDANGDALTAVLETAATNGTVVLNADGSFTYTPSADFTGEDSFTYRADDGETTASIATVRINVTPPGDTGEPFGTVTTGSFQDAGLLGIRTDLEAGAPPVTALHVDGDVDYSAHSNPPTYGNHHGFDPQGTDVNPGITPRPTGIYTTQQPDEDLVHNLEHGHIWISYRADLIDPNDLAALQQLLRDGAQDSNGGGHGVILTPRAENDTVIAVASWARLLKLDDYEPATIRSFIETNRGHAPEGFITP